MKDPLREQIGDGHDRLNGMRAGVEGPDTVDLPPRSGTDQLRVPDLPKVIGSFNIVNKLGEGGFGIVYLADQQSPVRRQVALKVMKGVGDSAEVVARFKAERQTLALMDHPNIARIFDAGCTPEGQFYFAMELVRGNSITKYCDDHRLTVPERLKLFVDVCHAVQNAHQKGVIHRDIKPSNVIVTEHDGRPFPKVIDFGVAKVGVESQAVRTFYTQRGQMIGTPEYMSPEQADPSGLDVDTRADVYALGIILYELLTGSVPFSFHGGKSPNLLEIQRVIKDVAPAKPSNRWSKVADEGMHADAAARGAQPQHLRRALQRDLDWITLKALEKDRARRYATADAFADDLRRYLNVEPVSAAPPSVRYRIRRFLRRYRRSLAVASFISMLLLVGVIGGYTFWQSTIREANSRKNAEVQSLLLSEQRFRNQVVRRDGWSTTSWDLLRRAAQLRDRSDPSEFRSQAAASLAGVDMDKYSLNFGTSSVAFGADGNELVAVGYTPELGPRPIDQRAKLLQLRGGYWQPQELRQAGSGDVAFTSDGKLLHLTHLSTRFRVTELRTGEIVSEFDAGGEPASTVITPDGRIIATALKSLEKNLPLLIWDAASGSLRYRIEGVGEAIALSPDGALAASGDKSGQLCIWSRATNTVERHPQFSGTPIYSLAFGRNPRSLRGDTKTGDEWILAVGNTAGQIKIWDIEHHIILDQYGGSPYGVEGMAFSPDGSVLAAGGSSPYRLWDVARGNLLLEFDTGSDMRSLSFSADGQKLAVGNAKTLFILNMNYGRGILTLRGLNSRVERTVCSPDGKRVAALSHDWMVGVWKISSRLMERDSEKQSISTSQLECVLDAPRGESVDNSSLVFSDDGKKLAISAGPRAELWDIEAQVKLNSWNLQDGICDTLAFDSNGRLLLFRKEANVCRLLELRADEPKPHSLYEYPYGRVYSVMAPADGRFFAVEGDNEGTGPKQRTIRIFDSRTGAEKQNVPIWGGYDYSNIAIDAAGDRIAFASAKDEYSELDTKTSNIHLFNDRAHNIRPNTFLPDGLFVERHPEATQKLSVALYARNSAVPLIRLGWDQDMSSLTAAHDKKGKLLAWGNADGNVFVCDLKALRDMLKEVDFDWK